MPDGVETTLRAVLRWSSHGAGPVDVGVGDGVELAALARDHGVLGPLVAASAHGVVELPDEVRAAVVAEHEVAMVWCLQLERRLLEIDAAFHAARVRYLVVKGPAVAHLDEADPSLRSFADLDLLVAGDDIERAIGVLTGLGAERRIPERRPGFDRRFVKGIGMVGDDDIELDVHRTLCTGPHGFRIPLDRVFAEAVTFDLGGRPIPAPSRRHRALHAGYHAMVGSASPPLRTLRDLAGYLVAGDLGPEVLGPEARRWRGEAVLAAAVEATIAAFDLDVPAWRTWLASVELDSAERRLVERGPGADRLVDWDVVRELGWRDRAAFLRAVAFPSAEVLSDRGETGWGRATAALRRGVS